MRKANLFLAAAFVAGFAMADDSALDVTITVVDSPGDLPAAVTKTIELPAAAADHAGNRAGEHAQPGFDSANQARTLSHEFGQNIADEAKTKGRGRGRP